MLQLGVEVVVEVRVQLLFRVVGRIGGSEKNEIMLYSTQLELKLKLELSLAK